MEDSEGCDPRLFASDLHDTKFVDKALFAFSMCNFITEVIKLNGEDYPPNMLKELVYLIQMFLHAKRVFWFLLDKSDVVFRDVLYVLDNEMKRCISEGLGVVRLATPVSLSIEEKNVA